MPKQRPVSSPRLKGAPGKSGRGPNEPETSTPEPAPSAPPPPPRVEPAPAASVRRSTYYEAVALYERGLEALQRHEYAHAVELLESVLRQFPDEKELHERVRLYLNVCRRHAAPPETEPRTLQERLYAATLAINGGQPDLALMHLRLVRDEDPDNDHALYMLAVAHAQRGEHIEAIAHLERAISLNPDNRALARRDPDFDGLRDSEEFRQALDVAPAGRNALNDRRRPPRPKSSR